MRNSLILFCIAAALLTEAATKVPAQELSPSGENELRGDILRSQDGVFAGPKELRSPDTCAPPVWNARRRSVAQFAVDPCNRATATKTQARSHLTLDFGSLARTSSLFDFRSGRESTDPQAPAQSGEDAAELAKKLSNPVASLISVPFQSNFDFHMGTGSGWRYTMNFQPVIPFALSPTWNLISRTIIPFIHQGNVVSPGTSQNGLGDITQSLFFSPNKTEPLIWAVGPVILVPTATNDFLGTKQLAFGPTVLGLKQQSGWTYGVLANHLWRVAGGSGRPRVNSTFIQPILSYNTKDVWTYAINAEASYDWTANHWAVPIHPTVSKLVRFGTQPVSFGGGLRCWVTSPSGGPKGCGLRIIVTALFPQKK